MYQSKYSFTVSVFRVPISTPKKPFPLNIWNCVQHFLAKIIKNIFVSLQKIFEKYENNMPMSGLRDSDGPMRHLYKFTSGRDDRSQNFTRGRSGLNKKIQSCLSLIPP